MKKNSKTNQYQRNKILYFPNKLNIITIFLIIVLYAGVLYASANVFPKPDYMVRFDYEPSYNNEDINPYIFTRGIATEEYKDAKTYNHISQTFLYLKPASSEKTIVYNFVNTAVDTDNITRYYTDVYRPAGSNISVTAITHYSSNENNLKKNQLEKLHVSVRYKIGTDSNYKTYQFSEEVLQLSKNDLSNPTFKLSNTIPGIVTVRFKNNGTDPNNSDRYRTRFEIELANKEKPFKITFQSWLVTSDEQIVPYVGLYNYRIAEDYKAIHDTMVYKYFPAKWIYTRLIYEDLETGKISELLYKANYQALIPNE